MRAIDWVALIALCALVLGFTLSLAKYKWLIAAYCGAGIFIISYLIIKGTILRHH